MPSPFPGMDPFLEAHWGDVHTRLTTYASDQLQPRLPGDLRARIEEYVHLEAEDSDATPRFSPDVTVVERATATRVRPMQLATVEIAAAEPLVVPFELEPWTERWIQILDKASNRVITTIEFLSPGNKLTLAKRAQFRQKQQQFLEAGVNVVEIDLLVDGRWAMSSPHSNLPDQYCYPYRIAVIRGHLQAQAECYKVTLRERLPAIRIPLRPHEPDIPLDIQPLIDAAWERGTYSDIDYSRDTCPAFRKEDEAWIQERIAAWKAGLVPKL